MPQGWEFTPTWLVHSSLVSFFKRGTMQNHLRCSCLDQLLKVRLPLGAHRLVGLGFYPAGNEAHGVTHGMFALPSVQITFPRTKLSYFIFCSSSCISETGKLLTRSHIAHPLHYSQFQEGSEFGLTSACHWTKVWCCIVRRWSCPHSRQSQCASSSRSSV